VVEGARLESDSGKAHRATPKHFFGIDDPFHIMRGEANVIALHVVVVGLYLFVAWGRFQRVPIRQRGTYPSGT
jgi:hypothetical protein